MRIEIDPTLESESTACPVKGRSGWLINQKLSFGDFETSKVERGWTRSYAVPFLIRFSAAREKLSFTLREGDKGQAEVFCIGRLREKDLRPFRDHFAVEIDSSDVFSGSVLVAEQTPFDFYVADLNHSSRWKEPRGRIMTGDPSIRIEPIYRLQSERKTLGKQALGFEFLRDGKALAAVDVSGRGVVWLRNDLTDEERITLAGVASALLLRNDLAEAIDDLE